MTHSDHSFAEKPSLTCPECGRPFTPELWLILDAAARPDLLARVRDGTIHHVVCPRGHGLAVDAPLLIYRPGQSPPILFSPSERTTAEQDGEMAGALMKRLAEALGTVWRDAWLDMVRPIPRAALAAVMDSDDPLAAATEALADAIPPGVQAALAEVAAALAADGVMVRSQEELDQALAARPALRARLEAAVRASQADAAPEVDRMADPLTTTLRAYVETPDWVESYRFLLAHPELLTDAADERLAWLVDAATTAGREPAAGAFAEHRALLNRARAVGATQAYAEKLGATPEQVAGLAAADPLPAATRQAFEEVVAALKAEGVAVDSPEALQAALAARPELAAKLEAALGAGESGPDVPAAFRDDMRRAQEAEARYRRNSDPAALDEAAAAWERILNHPGFAAAPESFQLAALNDAGGVLLRRYWAGGQLTDLDRALALWQTAIQRTPDDAPDRAMYQTNLGTGLSDRYARTGAAADLEAAIGHCRGAARAAGETAGEAALRAARAWAGLALRRGLWAEAGEAAALGQTTLRRLNAANALAVERDSWLKEAQGLAAAAAYAAARETATRPDAAAEAARLLETGQARAINAVLGRGRDRELLARLGDDDPALLVAYTAAAKAARTAQRAGPGDGPTPGGPPPDAGAQRQRAAAAQAALDDVIGRIRARPGYEALFAPAAFDDVAAAVAPGAPLAYLATTPAGSVILLLHRAGGAVAAEALWAALDEDELDRLLIRREHEAGNVGEVAGGLLVAQVTNFGLVRELAAALPALGERLMAPLAARLRQLGATAVTLIPGGRLNLLPLHAATYAADGAARAFLDEFAVAYAPSAQAAAESRARAGGAEQGGAGALVVGNPMPVHPPLRYAREEAEEVAALLGAAAPAGPVTPLYETDATLPAVAAALPGQRLLHFACHGTFDTREPLNSGLVMAGGEMLTLRAVRDGGALAGVRLAVLSACQTGLTDFNDLPDEVIGLPAGFLMAGAAGVAGSLWPVDDRSTALLMTEFHRRVLAGDTPAEALRQAQMWLRRVTWGELDAYYSQFLPRLSAPSAEAAQTAATRHDPVAAAYADPYHWAAFAFYGV